MDSSDEVIQCDQFVSSHQNVICGENSSSILSFMNTSKELSPIIQLLELDFQEQKDIQDDQPVSQEDRIFLAKVSEGVHQERDGRCVMLLPFKDSLIPNLLNNRVADLSRLPVERALGVHWCAETDIFRFHIENDEKPCTRRGILSCVSSVYNTLGFISPFTLRGKLIMQQLTKERLDWDDEVSPVVADKWLKWKSEVTVLRLETCKML